MNNHFLNDPGYEVPANTVLVVPFTVGTDGFYTDVIEPLKGKVSREWFNEHFYYCLPLNIGNQHGFLIKSVIDFDMIWDGSTRNPNDVTFEYLNEDNREKQSVKCGFAEGVVTVQNNFSLKTPPGINLMTIQPPNMFIPGCVSMTGVIETDQIRRDFTFNIKITVPNYRIQVRKGDPLGAFLPIPRYFVDDFKLGLISDYFEADIHANELEHSRALSHERNTVDLSKPHQSGRRYFKGIHADDSSYKDHQRRLRGSKED